MYLFLHTGGYDVPSRLMGIEDNFSLLYMYRFYSQLMLMTFSAFLICSNLIALRIEISFKNCFKIVTHHICCLYFDVIRHTFKKHYLQRITRAIVIIIVNYLCYYI